ncbi:hypothetical protein B0H15DRAFT_475780 [Mycena belliarum]|uniref:Uncharacterized protein n=1 Tax=Mycena belliarum TaxID=1033014 RepID=A0AAD6U0X0_9AGAR|nr:hypothetical protein B0H15DRAFT_475780 [Mycena belliae]
MGSLCFSSASILRCESFTTLESQLLIIPTALELIFSTTLIFSNRGTGWRHLLLTAEGWSYFALALLELLSHTLPAVRDSVSVFSVVDIFLGATSFFPILFYTLFVYLFTRAELIDTLPKRFQRIANTLLLIFIPAIIALNELSSFVGISRRTITLAGGREVVAIGFRNINDQQLWTFLTSLTLALLTAFEAINFCFAFHRLVRAFIDQRRIETTSTDQAHLIRGIGWITGGFKLGAIETVIGFANGGFGGALVRRIVRLLARAFLIIGIVKGVDQVDDFSDMTSGRNTGRQEFRRSRMAQLISNPRFSTFRQLSPTATKGFRPQSEIKPQMEEFTRLKREVTQTSMITAGGTRRERVTVHYGGGPPTLEMRFSGLEMPSPALIAEQVKARPVSSSWVSIAQSSRYGGSSIAPSFAFDPPTVPMPTTYPDFIYERAQPPVVHTRPPSAPSARSSGYPDTLTAVRELAAQFPMPTPVMERFGDNSGWAPDVESQRPSRQQSWISSTGPYPYEPTVDSAYGGSIGAQAMSPPRVNPHAEEDIVSPPATLSYAYEGMNEADSPEPVYRYVYDGPTSPDQVGVYASPDLPRDVRSTSTVTPSAATYLSPFGDGNASLSTAGTENPFRYDQDAPALLTGLSTKIRGYEAPVHMGDGPHHAKTRSSASSAALLQMTRRGDGGVSERWTPPEFTPSLFQTAAAVAQTTVTPRQTLKKRRPSQKSVERPTVERPTAAEALASSWMHTEMEDGEEEATISASAGPVRVKTVGRARASRKETPSPVTARHRVLASVYIQPITVPPAAFSSEVQIVQGNGSADSYNSEFGDQAVIN